MRKILGNSFDQLSKACVVLDVNALPYSEPGREILAGQNAQVWRGGPLVSHQHVFRLPRLTLHSLRAALHLYFLSSLLPCRYCCAYRLLAGFYALLSTFLPLTFPPPSGLLRSCSRRLY